MCVWLKFLVTCVLGLLTNSNEEVNNTVYCTCHSLELRCSGFEDLETLKRTISDQITSCSASELRLYNVQMPALDNEVLEGWKKLRIHNSSLPFLVPPVDESPRKSLVEVTFEEVSYPFNWDWKVLNSWPKLNTLRITNSNFLYINPSFSEWEGSSLHVLVIENSQVKWIHDRSFSSFRELSFLQFSNNKVEAFQRSILPKPAEYLSIINFKNNNLQFIEEDLFFEMPELTYVNLEKNNFKTLPEEMLSGKIGWRLFMDISGNPLLCDCSIKWLQDRSKNFDLNRLFCFTEENEKIPFREVNWNDLICYRDSHWLSSSSNFEQKS